MAKIQRTRMTIEPPSAFTFILFLLEAMGDEHGLCEAGFSDHQSNLHSQRQQVTRVPGVLPRQDPPLAVFVGVLKVEPRNGTHDERPSPSVRVGGLNIWRLQAKQGVARY